MLGIHTNVPGAVPASIDQASFAGAPAPAGLSDEEKYTYDALVFFYKHVYYAFEMATRPQTLAALADSPIGLPPVSIRHRSSGRPAARNDDGFAERSPIFLLADRIHRPQLRE